MITHLIVIKRQDRDDPKGGICLVYEADRDRCKAQFQFEQVRFGHEQCGFATVLTGQPCDYLAFRPQDDISLHVWLECRPNERVQ
jgi:hypothetical protein